MSDFKFMSFGYDAGDHDMFVAHAKKYTATETVDLCKREFEYLFRNRRIAGKEVKALREPTIHDVCNDYCAFRFGMYGWPGGCYTFVSNKERGSFPVWVIDFSVLKLPCKIG